MSVLGKFARRMPQIVATIARVWSEGSWARRLRLRARARQLLPNLHELYPKVRTARRYELGLMTVALDDIAGTAVEGRAQRGGDFRPLPPMRTANWKARWLSLHLAQDRLVALPPVVLSRVGGAYWVVDGHNRVAFGLEIGKVAIDAIVTRLAWNGAPPDPGLEDRGSMAAMLAGSDELRAAGNGRFAPTALAGGLSTPSAGTQHGVACDLVVAR
jgi:hypothetical protein